MHHFGSFLECTLILTSAGFLFHNEICTQHALLVICVEQGANLTIGHLSVTCSDPIYVAFNSQFAKIKP